MAMRQFGLHMPAASTLVQNDNGITATTDTFNSKSHFSVFVFCQTLRVFATVLLLLV